MSAGLGVVSGWSSTGWSGTEEGKADEDGREGGAARAVNVVFAAIVRPRPERPGFYLAQLPACKDNIPHYSLVINAYELRVYTPHIRHTALHRSERDLNPAFCGPCAIELGSRIGVNDLLSKLSSYNLFNYLFPGVIAVVFASRIFGYSISLTHNSDIFIAGFICYFVGLIVSRFGSIVLEPVLKKAKFIKFSDYREFVLACQKDKQIEVLSEANNTYRTLCSLMILLLLADGYAWISSRFTVISHYQWQICVGLLFIVFLFSHRKQTSYITKRVKANQ